MFQIYPRLWVGSEADCCIGCPSWAVVHACKHPCHKRALGYAGNLALDNPHYLAFQRGHDLYLNLIDLPKSLFQLASFEQFLAFACANCGQGLELLIHCNQGGSRAPTLALLLLGNLAIHLLWQSYDEGAEWLRNVYSAYNPGLEIQDLLR